jgi:lipopolysaccharide export LptBFGC system permease protein LptF
MRISDRYIGKQVLLGTFYAVMVLGIVLVLGNLFKEIQRLLVDFKAPLELVIRFVIGIIPVSLMYTIPWGFLSAVLIVFGRLSSNHEITSFRVAGISLVRLSAPVFAIGVGLSLISFWLNANVVPLAKANSKNLTYVYYQAARDPSSLLKPGMIKSFESDEGIVQKLLIEGKSGEWVEGFHFYRLPLVIKSQKPSKEMTYIHAAKAALSIDYAKRQLRVKLQDAYFETRNAEGRTDVAFAGEAAPLVIDLKDFKAQKMRPSTMSNEEIKLELATNKALTSENKLQLQSEITRRYSFSMACLAFAFIAVPLGLQTSRRDSSRGLMFSLLIGAGYFLITMLANQVKDHSTAMMVLWLPNVLCILLGLILFRRARFK